MNKQNFFQEVTLSICSSLDLNKALSSLLEYLQTIIPVSAITFHFLDQEEKTTSIIAATELSYINLSRPYTGLTLAEINQNLEMVVIYAKSHDDMSVFPNVEFDDGVIYDHNDPMFLKFPVIILHMVIEGKPSGALIFQIHKDFKITDQYLELFRQVHAPCALAVNNCLHYQKTLKLQEKLSAENIQLQQKVQTLTDIEVIGASTGLKDVMDLVNYVAPLPTPVFIQGESGVGKEVIANTIHKLSPKKDMPYIVVNCGAINPNLLESELFGHEKGSFTNAIRAHKGVFERAENGTIFLDEICELALESQTKLLRVLQNSEIQRVGGNKNISVNVRVISATNKNIKQAVIDGVLREDLYYRLNVFPIEIPPLRDHKEDIPILVDYFLRKKAAKLNKVIPTVSPSVMQSLMQYDWAGNIRELENFIERALILSPHGQLLIPQGHEIHLLQCTTKANKLSSLEEMSKKHIEDVLAYTKGKISGKNGAAEILGVNRLTLYRRLAAFGIDNKYR